MIRYLFRYGITIAFILLINMPSFSQVSADTTKKPKDLAKSSAINLPGEYEEFETKWSGSSLAISYPQGWTVTDMNKVTGFIEAVSFVKDKKAARALYKNGNMEIATGQKVRLVTEGNVIINVAVQPEDISNIKPEKFINMMGTVVNNPGEVKMRTAEIAQNPMFIRSVTGTDIDGRKVSSHQVATKRDERLVTISAYFPGGSFEVDEQVEAIITKMLESLKVTGK